MTIDLVNPSHARAGKPAMQTTSEAIVSPEKIFDVAGIARCWSLSDSEQRELLGGISYAQFERWRLGDFEGFNETVSARMLRLFEIFDLLQRAFHQSETADGWVRRPNYDLHGRTPLSIMMEGVDGLESVRRHLDGLTNEHIQRAN